jgi:DNA-binding SARP family transcriptional activator/predicted ATPase
MERVESPLQLRIEVLGPPRVLLGQTPIAFTRRKALALLVYLARSGRAHTREALAALLTDATDAALARGQLRSVLKDLRSQLGEYLAVSPDGIALTPDRPVWLDLAELEAAAQDESAPASLERLAHAVSLYRGEFLAGLTISQAPKFEGWLLGERERAKGLLCRVLTRLVDHTSGQGDLPVAMGWARRLLEEEPWHEPTHRQLMRLLAHAGQREAAVAQYKTCRSVLAEELGSAPQPETTALFEQLRAGPIVPPTNLPAPQSGFVGREAELAVVAARLADPACRLLTLLGLGGSGKTSLALRAAARQAYPAALADEHPFPDGVYLVDLAGVSAPSRGSVNRTAVAMQRIATEIGRVLELAFRGADPVVHLAAWLHKRAVLLVLDNMEHLLDGAELLTLLLQRSPRLKLLVTTRERLRLLEEWVVEVNGLPLPAGPEEVERAPASCLYLQLLRQAGAIEPPGAPERAAIERVCQMTQGLPLALVLAAHWTPILSTAEIARELATNLNLLSDTHGHRAPDRQRSMRVVLQATWDRLSRQERQALRRLAVFQPGFAPEAAQAVAAVNLATLLMLCEAVLLGRDSTIERYAMHEFVRQYAAEQLVDHPGEEAEMHARHAAFYAALVERLAPGLRQTGMAILALSADLANIRVAWDWAAERAEAGILERMLEGLARWYDFQGLPGQAAEALGLAAEGLRAALAQAATPDPAVQRLLGFVLVEEAYALCWLTAYSHARSLLDEAHELARITASPRLEGHVAYRLGYLLFRQRDLGGAMHWLRQALALARAAQQPDLEADSLSMLGWGAVWAGEYRQADGYLEQASALNRTRDDRYREAGVAYLLGVLARARGDFGEAQRLLEGTLHDMRATGWYDLDANLLHELGQVHDQGWGRHVVAEGFFGQDLRSTQKTGDRTREGFALAALGRNALYQGDLEGAAVLFEQALSLSREVRSPQSAVMALRGQSLLAHYLGDDQRAHRCAQEALAITQETGLRPKERLAMRLLGHALLGLGELPAAQAAYQQVRDLDEMLEVQHLRIETATDLARVDLVQGDIDQAVARVTTIVPDLETGALAGLEEPALAYLTCYRVLRAAGDARATGVLAAGHAFLQERSEQFADEQQRAEFLATLPAHRELLAEWQAHGGWTASVGEPAARTGAAPRPLDIGRRARLRIVQSESG